MFQPIVIDCSGPRDTAIAGLARNAEDVAAARRITAAELAEMRAKRAAALAQREAFVADVMKRANEFAARGISIVVPELMKEAPVVFELPPFAETPAALQAELAALLDFMLGRAELLSGDHAIGITIRAAPNSHRAEGADDVDTGFTASVSYSEYPEIR